MAKRKAAETDDTAVEDAPKKRGRPPKAKQPMLNDDPAFQRIKELEDLAQSLDQVRSERIQLSADEGELQDKLAEAMKAHGLDTYGAVVGMCIRHRDDKEKVKIKKVREAKTDGSLA